MASLGLVGVQFHDLRHAGGQAVASITYSAYTAYMINALGELIKRKRAELGLSQAQLGRRVGVSQVAISEWERGVVQPSKPLELATAIGVSKEELKEVIAAGFISKDRVEQEIRQEQRLSWEAREALVTVYRYMLKGAAGPA